MYRDNEEKFRVARILIVDDDRRILEGLRTHLSAMGYHCTTRGNAGEAMMQFAAGNFDLVITDLTMPGIDGLSIIGLVRSQSDIPILVITGHTAEYQPLIIGYPNVTLIQKPVDPQALRVYIRFLLLRDSKADFLLRCG
jgi:DNA-binding response OmpR family regulator